MKIMVYDGPKKIRVEEVSSMPLNDVSVRIKSMYSGLSHGTEMCVYRGQAPFFKGVIDSKTNLYKEADEKHVWNYPIRSSDEGVWYMGYALVGTVIEIGSKVKSVKEGDIVYSSSPHQSEVVVPESDVIKLPDNIPPEHGVFFTNIMTVHNAILDSKIKLGDVIFISGMGVLGQLAVQMAKMSGAFRVYGMDIIDKRLSIAKENGLDRSFNPNSCKDIALAVRKFTNNKGPDVVLEISGNDKALYESLRVAPLDGLVVAVSWYMGRLASVDMSTLHSARVGFKHSHTSSISPEFRHLWDDKRRKDVCLEMLPSLNLSNVITHRIPHSNIAEAFRIVDENPEDILQVVLTY